MRIETMLDAYHKCMETRRKRIYWWQAQSIRIGIIRRYNALQAENARLRAELATSDYLLSECVNGAETVNAELQGLRDENASLRKTIRGMDGDLAFMLDENARLRDEVAQLKAEHDAAEYLLTESENVKP